MSRLIYAFPLRMSSRLILHNVNTQIWKRLDVFNKSCHLLQFTLLLPETLKEQIHIQHPTNACVHTKYNWCGGHGEAYPGWQLSESTSAEQNVHFPNWNSLFLHLTDFFMQLRPSHSLPPGKMLFSALKKQFRRQFHNDEAWLWSRLKKSMYKLIHCIKHFLPWPALSRTVLCTTTRNYYLHKCTEWARAWRRSGVFCAGGKSVSMGKKRTRSEVAELQALSAQSKKVKVAHSRRFLPAIFAQS